jgi:PncC family amidohydrolase
MSTADQSAVVLGTLLCEKSYTIATAESCTGGLIGARISDIPGASQYFSGGVIAYSNTIKQSVLGVSSSLLSAKGAVSGEVVKAMCTGVCRLFKTRCAIAVSGIAGPEGGTEEKPVGLVYIGIAAPGVLRDIRVMFSGTRQEIRNSAARRSIEEMIRVLRKQV